MTKKINVGVVGCGQIAQIAHLPYIEELPQFELTALCDISPVVVNTLGENYHVGKRYSDFNDLVKQPEIDAVLVSNKDHFSVIMAALEAGKHVLAEKPMVFNLRQADEVIAAARRNKRVLMVAYMKRYDPAFLYALEMFKSIQKIHLVRMHDFAGSYKINNEIYDLVTPIDLEQETINEVQKTIKQAELEDIGLECKQYLELYDILLHLCIHDINVINGAFGIPEYINHVQIYDKLFVNALMEYKDGKKLMWESGNVLELWDWDEQLWVYGSDKRVGVRFPFPYLKNAATTVNINSMEGTNSVDKRVVASFDEAFKREWRHFSDCIVKDQKPITNATEARADIAFLADLLKTATS